MVERKVKQGGTTFTFVTDGIESAMAQARAAAGAKDIAVGAANTAQQFLRAGLIDEIQVHLTPIPLGDGVRLFDETDTAPLKLETTRVIRSPGVTHLRFRVPK